MKIRTELKTLFRQRAKLSDEITVATEEYIHACGDGPLLYITEHAIVRYLERVKKLVFNDKLSDLEKLKAGNIPPEKVRAEMLSQDEQIDIVRGMRHTHQVGEVRFIIENLTVVTVIIREKP